MKPDSKTALFVSPHLDDVAFSCGGTFARLASENWGAILCTVFTKSIENPKNFALSCQTDKGLSAAVDYLKLRRAEDFQAAEILGASEILHLNFAEAPHRGYESAPELFAGIKKGDDVWQTIAAKFAALDRIHQPEIVFAPQGLGNHADHLQTIRAARASFQAAKILWYRDTPYAIREPNAAPTRLLPAELSETFYDIEIEFERKILACAAYRTQIDFQFGGAAKLAEKLRLFHRKEAERSGIGSTAVEAFLFEAKS